MKVKIFVLLALASCCQAVDFEEANRFAESKLAPRTIAQHLNHTISGARFEDVAWRENTVLLAYEFTDEWGRKGAGWYLADVDKEGQLAWYAHTVYGPNGMHALEFGQGADVASTLAGLGRGFVEGNPIGAPGAFVMKLVAINSIKQGSALDCMSSYALATQFGWGAAIWNAALIAGGGPVGAVLGLAGGFAFSKPEHNQVFWACAPRR